MKFAIEATNLKKAYKVNGEEDFVAVKNISFQVREGKCVGLLGPNGAGKTTTMRMIMGLTSKTEGSLNLFDVPVENITRAEKAKVGLVPQEDNLDPDLTVEQNLRVYGSYFGIKKAEIKKRVPILLDFMKLTEKAGAQVNHLSGGMKRRLVIARSLINDPNLVILDEPTTGLDPQARVMIWQRLLDLKKQGKTLLLTTHYMDEAQRLCDHIIIVDNGKVLDEGTPKQLISKHVKSYVYEVPKPLIKELKNTGLDNEDVGNAVLFFVNNPEKILKLLPEGATFYSRPANLEDVFLRLTGHQLRE